ncbi:unnamed protein product [Trichogramma brassicae]|uniref:Carboxylesterase type B domain-containing protein n=1 Tax=Trichogramma brassicae TaxID=86971 RepID=A0A6H5I2U8_9HYME|nr:unnamed protein product [Trichogramma brassicae]
MSPLFTTISIDATLLSFPPDLSCGIRDPRAKCSATTCLCVAYYRRVYNSGFADTASHIEANELARLSSEIRITKLARATATAATRSRASLPQIVSASPSALCTTLAAAAAAAAATTTSNDRGLRSSDDLGYMRGGGVAFYLHNSLNFAVLESPSVPDLDEAEFMMLDVSTAAESVCQHVLVVVLYRQPDGPAGLALTLFFSVLDNYRHSFKNIIIMGDFNVDMNRCDNFSRHLSTLIHERGLYLVPSPNTHFTYRPSSTLIDLTIIDESSKLLRYSVGDVPIAGGHCVTVLGYRLPSRPVNYREVTYRDFRNCDVAVLRDMVSADMADLFSSERELDITALVSAFNECVVRCLDRCAPFVTRPFRRPPAPWFTPELRRSCRERDRLYRLARRLGSSRMLQEYKIRRRAIKALIFEARRAYLAVAVEAAPDQASVWSLLRREGVLPSSRGVVCDRFSPDVLNQHYAAVAGVHPPCSLARLRSIVDTVAPGTADEFRFSRITEIDVLKKIYIFSQIQCHYNIEMRARPIDALERAHTHAYTRGRPSAILSMCYFRNIWSIQRRGMRFTRIRDELSTSARRTTINSFNTAVEATRKLANKRERERTSLRGSQAPSMQRYTKLSRRQKGEKGTSSRTRARGIRHAGRVRESSSYAIAACTQEEDERERERVKFHVNLPLARAAWHIARVYAYIYVLSMQHRVVQYRDRAAAAAATTTAGGAAAVATSPLESSQERLTLSIVCLRGARYRCCRCKLQCRGMRACCLLVLDRYIERVARYATTNEREREKDRAARGLKFSKKSNVQPFNWLYFGHEVGMSEGGRRHPVLVFIHGESYDWGSGNTYDGSVLAAYSDQVVITINYRLGVLGFLNANVSPHTKARVANYGLMDQIAALHWIQQNVEYFGGDPSNVTLMGQGTGAACVNFLAISPTVMSGLFKRAILLSGSALSSWAVVDEPASYALKLARAVNCSVPADLIKDHELLVDCLRESSLEALMRADLKPPTFLSAFGPSVDGVVIKPDFKKDLLSFLGPEFQGYGYASKRAEHGETITSNNKYDLLFGVTTNEALWKFAERDVQKGFEGERRDRIIRTYVRNAYMYHLTEIFYTIVNEYTDWERTVQHPVNTRDACIQALSDAQFVAPLVQTGDLFTLRHTGKSAGHGGSSHDDKNQPKNLLLCFRLSNEGGRLSTVYTLFLILSTLITIQLIIRTKNSHTSEYRVPLLTRHCFHLVSNARAMRTASHVFPGLKVLFNNKAVYGSEAFARRAVYATTTRLAPVFSR